MLPADFFRANADYVNSMKSFMDRDLLNVELEFERPGQNTELHGRKVVSFASNDYLGLIQDPAVKEVAAEAARTFGPGAGSSMLGSGSLRIHAELEEELADFVGKEATCLFPTGYSAMLGFGAANIINGGKIYCDSLNHRSIIDGLMLGVGSIPDRSNQFHYFKHNCLEHLERVHRLQHRDERYDLCFIEGVYSMDGDQGDLKALVPYCSRNAMVSALDDAHGFGVLGRHGRGAADHHQVTDQVDFILGTFSKSLACTGGFCCGDKDAILYLKATASVYMFSASVVPVNVQVARHVIARLRRDDSLQKRLWENIAYLKRCLAQAGFDFGIADSAVIPVLLSGTEKSFYFARRLLQEGIFIVAVTYPVVKRGLERLRISVNAGHRREDIDLLVSSLVKVRKEWEEAGQKVPTWFKTQAVDTAPLAPQGADSAGEERVFQVIRSKILEVLPGVDPQAVTLEVSLKELGANSVDRVEVATNAMEELGLRLPRIELAKATNLRELTRLFASHLTA
jgi:7-keto-8-aminopelargonate synthetase-like enzyme/acyl carrier protein